MSAEDVNLVAWVEGVRIPDLNQPVTSVDLSSLLSLLHSSAGRVGANKNATIRADCDVLKLLAKYLPDFAKLTSAAKDRKISIQDLRTVEEPFYRGEKPIPDPKASAIR